MSIVTRREDFQALEEPWNHLLVESSSNTFFLRWEWVWAWWEAFGASLGTLHILLVKRGERVVGIGPFYWMATTQVGLFPVRRLLFLGTAIGGKGDVGTEYIDLIVLPHHQEEVVEAMSAHLLQEDQFHEWMFLHVPDQAPGLFALLARAGKARYWLQEMHRWQCPYITLPARWEQFLESLGSTLRYKFRKNLRELEKHGAYFFRTTHSIEELDRDLQTLVLLHQARWEGRGMSGVFADPAYQHFLSMVSRAALQRGLLRLSIITVLDKPVAAVYNIVYGNKVYYYQSGFDTAFDRKVAIGTFAHTLCIEQAIGEKLDEYDFLLKGSLDTYKDRWTRAVREIVDYRLIAPGWPQWMAKVESSVRGYVRQFRKVQQ
ncbi:MAG TPA: GNAT family N-acetyltransferase [Nitrospira sp.]|nr:GNAT family N-acetyltransferase [Nitrospira sp.]